jgi:hypothetical protein
MRHQGLEISGIRKLVTEREKIDAVDGLTKVLISNIDRLIADRFAKGRRLSFTELRTVFQQADDVFRQKTSAVATSFTHVPGTFARPKSFAAESLYLGIRRMKTPPNGFYDVYQLFAFRLLGSAKCVMLEVEYLPLAFQYHAAERLLERVRDTDAAFLDVAKALAQWSLVIKKAQYTAVHRIGGFLNIPAVDNRGALLGEYVSQLPEPAVSIEYNERGGFESRWAAPTLRHSMFIVSTFVDRFVLRPNQLFSMNLLTDWKSRLSEEYERVNSGLLWPATMAHPRITCLDKHALDGLDTVLGNPELLRAMHPEKEVNRTQSSDYQLPLGAWALEASRPASSQSLQTGGPFEGMVRRRKAFGQ